eukprot:215580-Pyramimonas_sp.AAC.1
MTRTVRIVWQTWLEYQTEFSWIREADAPDVSESIPVITRPAAPLQPEFNAENRGAAGLVITGIDSETSGASA